MASEDATVAVGPALEVATPEMKDPKEEVQAVTGDGPAVFDDNTTKEPSTDDAMPPIKAEQALAENDPNPVPAAPTMDREADMLIKTEQPVASVKSTEAEQPTASVEPTEIKQERKTVSLKSVREVADSMDLATVEAGVSAATAILDQLHVPMSDFKENQELAVWLKSINLLKARAKTAGRTVIAVAGATGAGKSSLINAVLDEEKLLPTNGMRACTATITEIAFNEDADPSRAYRAVVDFISPEEWHEELMTLFSELIDDNQQLSPAHRDANSEAGVAYAKVKSVYHDLTNDILVKSSPDQLAKNDKIMSYLGTQKNFACETAAQLHSALSIYLDSKEKNVNTGRPVSGMALWPIIRSVRIFTRADALSTGVCLVDLPGTLDSNAARSAVANKYMAECTAVWVASRISRAVDDKAAKDLLGRSSRIQMKMDGHFSHLSFIATQTDGINFQETMDALDEDGQIQATFAREDELAATIVSQNKEVQRMDKYIADVDEEFNALDAESETWQSLAKKHKQGKKVYAPSAPAKGAHPAKRRRTARQRAMEDSDDNEASKVPLTEVEIRSKVEELEKALATKEAEFAAAEEQHLAAKKSLEQLQLEKADIAIQRAWTCIRKRNDYCREAIRQDFAAGIREIDEEDGQDSEDYDPSVTKRDYEQVASSLPVFCISSKAYQQFRKPARGETRVEGFRAVEDSQIPSLQEHAKNASRSGQVRSNQAFLSQFSQLLNSLNIWTTKNEFSLKLGEVEGQDFNYEVKYLEAKSADLKRKLQDMVLKLKTDLFNISGEISRSGSTDAAKHASDNLHKIVYQWNNRKSGDQARKLDGYGLAFGTYRSTCNRGGEKTPHPNARNFNEDLMEPYLLKIATPWEQTFTKTIPAKLNNFADVFMNEVRDFHYKMVSRAELQKGRIATLRILGDQLQNHDSSIKDAINTVKTQLTAEQREASRLFVPAIKEQMKKVYARIASEKGPGCFKRMKEMMEQETKKIKKTLYKSVEKRVRKGIETAFETVINSLLDDCEQIRGTLENDYKLVLTSSETIEVNAVVREHVRELLCNTDTIFDNILATATKPMDVDPVPVGQAVKPVASASSAEAPGQGANTSA